MSHGLATVRVLKLGLGRIKLSIYVPTDAQLFPETGTFTTQILVSMGHCPVVSNQH